MPSVIDGIVDHPKPGDAADWWSQQKPQDFAFPLDDEEQGYLEFFTSDSVPKELWVGRGIASKDNLTPEETAKAAKLFGDGPNATLLFANYENRRRIIAHYVFTHPATIAYEMQLYSTTRDVFLPLFLAERAYEIFTGKEAMTDRSVSRLEAGVELLIPVVIGRVLQLARPGLAVMRPATRALTDPIWDLPDKGGMTINGRWYTEHALERMAPDTPAIRERLSIRAAERLRKLGIREGSPVYEKCLARSLKKIDPRGVPPSIVEAEINSPGSTNVKVVTARGGKVVISVIPKKIPAK